MNFLQFQNKHVHQASGGSKAPKVTEGGDGSGGEEDTITANESNIEKSVEDSHTDEHIVSIMQPKRFIYYLL